MAVRAGCLMAIEKSDQSLVTRLRAAARSAAALSLLDQNGS
jgi:hypothetical protein